jgi:hypothetical protein
MVVDEVFSGLSGRFCPGSRGGIALWGSCTVYAGPRRPGNE